MTQGREQHFRDAYTHTPPQSNQTRLQPRRYASHNPTPLERQQNYHEKCLLRRALPPVHWHDATSLPFSNEQTTFPCLARPTHETRQIVSRPIIH